MWTAEISAVVAATQRRASVESVRRSDPHAWTLDGTADCRAARFAIAPSAARPSAIPAFAVVHIEVRPKSAYRSAHTLRARRRAFAIHARHQSSKHQSNNQQSNRHVISLTFTIWVP